MRSRRSSSPNCRTTLSTASHCITAALRMVNLFFIPSVGMKQTTTERLVSTKMVQWTGIRAIGSGSIRPNNRKTEAGNQKAEKFRHRFLISIFTLCLRVFVVEFPSTFTGHDKLLAISVYQRHIVGDLCCRFSLESGVWPDEPDSLSRFARANSRHPQRP